MTVYRTEAPWGDPGIASKLARKISHVGKADRLAGRTNAHVSFAEQLLCGDDPALDNPRGYGRARSLAKLRRQVTGRISDG